MGTRALTHFIETDGETICTIYSQHDGYPEWHGKELKRVCPNDLNGSATWGPDRHKPRDNEAQGMGCFAMKVIKAMKKTTGNFYMVRHEPGRCFGHEWEYEISEMSENSGKFRKPFLRVCEVLRNEKSWDMEGKRVTWEGFLEDFNPEKPSLPEVSNEQLGVVETEGTAKIAE